MVPRRTHWSVKVKIGCRVDGMAKLGSGGQTSGKTDHVVKLGRKLSSVQTNGMVVKIPFLIMFRCFTILRLK
jgi:hypothetical protein